MPRIRTIVGGAMLAFSGAAAAFYWERRANTVHFRLVIKDDPFALRDYPPILVASVVHVGARDKALKQGFARLAEFTARGDRGNPNNGSNVSKIWPVLHERTQNAGEWRTRFIMPLRDTQADVAAPPHGITLDEVPMRRVAAITFSGSPNDAALRQREDSLRRWCEGRGLQPVGQFEYASYDAPPLPPFLRKNEVWVPVARGTLSSS